MVKVMLKEKSVLNINRLENSKEMCSMTVVDLVFTLITRNRYHTVFSAYLLNGSLTMSCVERGSSSINLELIDYQSLITIQSTHETCKGIQTDMFSITKKVVAVSMMMGTITV